MRVLRPLVPYWEGRHPGALPRLALPAPLRFVVPSIGSVWAWEPLKPNAYCRVKVTATKWNGATAWIESITIAYGPAYAYRAGDNAPRWDTLASWMESAVLVSNAQDYLPQPTIQNTQPCNCERQLTPNPECLRHGHAHCHHHNVCCICEFGLTHTQWQRTGDLNAAPPP